MNVELRGTQRKFLRGLAHELRPAVHVGKEGLSGPVLQSIEEAFSRQELIKVKLAGDRIERKGLATTVDEALGCSCVGLIGSVAIFYRQHPDAEKRKIVLPA